MPVITVYGIPEKEISEAKLSDIKKAMISKVCGIKELKLSADQVSIFFPKDCLSAGLGEELIIFVDGLFDKPERTKDVRRELALGLVETVYMYIQWLDKLLIECFVRPFNEEWGFASGRNTPAG